MRASKIFLLILVLLAGFLPVQPSQARRAEPAPAAQVTAFDLIIAMNSLRMSYGLPALIEDPIINAVAQATAETMAANLMSWHIGDVRGRIAASGYGGGGTVWATENFAVGTMGIDEIMAAWADPDHMRPAVTPAYCHIGAGTARASNGRTYYVLQAAYVGGKECGTYTSVGGGSVSQPGSGSVGQFIAPVTLATPDAEGNVYHVVAFGQSLWSIAIAYQVTIRDIETWNNISRDIPLPTGQKLLIPGENTLGYATPTPKGMILRATPDADGRIVHMVEPYQVLITISQTYDVSLERILTLNGIQPDWPLQVGQELLIDPGNVTPSPTLSAIQRLTPASDGNYYHTVRSGETLSWIAGLYGLPLQSLMNWNGLNDASIIRTDQRLLLLVTPPATATFTPLPPSPTATLQPTLTATPSPLAVDDSAAPQADGFPGVLGVGLVGLALIALAGGLAWLWRKEAGLKKNS